jgi:hypothetical protein
VRKCQFEDLDEKKRYDTQSSNGRLHEKPSQRKDLCKERWNEERMPVLVVLVPGSHEHLTSRKHVMYSRNMGVHVRRGIRSTKGKRTG